MLLKHGHSDTETWLMTATVPTRTSSEVFRAPGFNKKEQGQPTNTGASVTCRSQEL